MNDKDKQDLTVGRPTTVILSLFVPILASAIFQQLYNIFDTYIIGQFLGVEKLAAFGCTVSIYFLLFGFIGNMAHGLSILTGQYFGAKDYTNVRKSIFSCVLISIIFTIPVIIFGIVGSRLLLELLETPEELLEDAYDILMVYSLGAGFNLLMQLLVTLMRVLGNSKVPTAVQMIVVFINIILDVFAIVVLKLGIIGVALATVVSWIIGFIALFAYIANYMPLAHFHREDMVIDKKFIFEHFKNGYAAGFQVSFIALGQIVRQLFLNELGQAAISSFAVTNMLETVIMIPMISLGNTMAVYTAQNYGAKKFDRIIEGIKKSSFIVSVYSIAIALFNVHFSEQLVKFFAGNDSRYIIEYGKIFFQVSGWAYIFLALLQIFRFSLQGMAQMTVPVASTLAEFFVRLACVIFLVKPFEYTGICLANPLAWIGSCSISAIGIFITIRKWKKVTPESFSVNHAH